MPEAHVAMVTGASGGIGAVIARRLALSGAAVLVCGRDAERTARVAAEIEDLGGVAWALELDVTRPDSIAAAVSRGAELAARLGPIAWLVNNAGIADSAPFLRPPGDPEEFFARHLEVNFHGPRRATEALAPAMLERGYGRVVHVASSAGLQGYGYVSAYCASKHALVGWARAAALELEGKGVTMNLVCPHYVDSPMTDRSAQKIADKTGKTFADARALLAGENPGRRLVDPIEVADATLGLLTGEVNGAEVELDGSGEWPPGEGGGRVSFEVVQPAGWAAPRGYSNGLIAPPGARMLFVAGQVAWDAEQQMVGEGDFAAQFGQALENVVAVVRAAGGGPEHLGRLTIYVVDKDAYSAALPGVGAAYRRIMGRHYPVMALVQVAALLEPGALIEIEGTAALD